MNNPVAPKCENLDGQCSASWCDCAYLRQRAELARILRENATATGNPLTPPKK